MPGRSEVAHAHKKARLPTIRRLSCKPQANRDLWGAVQLRDARFNRGVGCLSDYSLDITESRAAAQAIT